MCKGISWYIVLDPFKLRTPCNGDFFTPDSSRGGQLSNIQVRRITDNVPIEVISKDSAWTKIVEDMNNRYPTSRIEDYLKVMQ